MNGVDDFWIRCFFGCDQDEYYSNKNIVCPHLFFAGYNGFFVLHIHNKFIISAPDNYVDFIKKAAAEDAINFYDGEVWKTLLRNHFDFVIGPSWIGYCREAPSVHVESYIRKLNLKDKDDIKSLNDLRNNCDAAEWRNSSIGLDSEAIFAQFIDSKIVSAVSYKLWGEKVAQIGIITRPFYRGKGYAENVLRNLTAYGLENRLIMQYRTLCSNTAAVKAAESCNYDYYATHISVRLK